MLIFMMRTKIKVLTSKQEVSEHLNPLVSDDSCCNSNILASCSFGEEDFCIHKFHLVKS